MEECDSIIKLSGYGRFLANLLGDCPNIPQKAFEDKLLWTTMVEDCGIKLQQNNLLGYSRIIDAKGMRVAWGSEKVMKEKYDRLVGDDFLRPGDIVGISRGIYEHYAVYVGDGEVIQYSGSEEDMAEDVRVRKASFDEFLRSENNYFILYFEGLGHTPKKIYRCSEISSNVDFVINSFVYDQTDSFELFSPEDTVLRAKSKLGEKQYDLVSNNCEHFALWCKTGLSLSFQVRKAAYLAASLLDCLSL